MLWKKCVSHFDEVALFYLTTLFRLIHNHRFLIGQLAPVLWLASWLQTGETKSVHYVVDEGHGLWNIALSLKSSNLKILMFITICVFLCSVKASVWAFTLEAPTSLRLRGPKTGRILCVIKRKLICLPNLVYYLDLIRFDKSQISVISFNRSGEYKAWISKHFAWTDHLPSSNCDAFVIAMPLGILLLNNLSWHATVVGS